MCISYNLKLYIIIIYVDRIYFFIILISSYSNILMFGFKYSTNPTLEHKQNNKNHTFWIKSVKFVLKKVEKLIVFIHLLCLLFIHLEKPKTIGCSFVIIFFGRGSGLCMCIVSGKNQSTPCCDCGADIHNYRLLSY